MAMQRTNNRRVRVVARSCYFCDKDLTPNYKDTANISKFLSERGKIMGHAKTGICSKHQRALTMAVKHARQVALLPFVVQA